MGGFYVKNSTSYEKNMYWRDIGQSREETLSSSSSSFQIGTTAIFGQEIDPGESVRCDRIPVAVAAQAQVPRDAVDGGHDVLPDEGSSFKRSSRKSRDWSRW